MATRNTEPITLDTLLQVIDRAAALRAASQTSTSKRRNEDVPDDETTPPEYTVPPILTLDPGDIYNHDKVRESAAAGGLPEDAVITQDNLDSIVGAAVAQALDKAGVGASTAGTAGTNYSVDPKSQITDPTLQAIFFPEDDPELANYNRAQMANGHEPVTQMLKPFDIDTNVSPARRYQNHVSNAYAANPGSEANVPFPQAGAQDLAHITNTINAGGYAGTPNTNNTTLPNAGAQYEVPTSSGGVGGSDVLRSPAQAPPSLSTLMGGNMEYGTNSQGMRALMMDEQQLSNVITSVMNTASNNVVNSYKLKFPSMFNTR